MSEKRPTNSEHKHQCIMCQKAVSLPKSRKEKLDEKKEEKEARQNGGGSSGDKIRLKHDDSEDLDEGIRMRLCGCLFCKECFEFFINEELDRQKGKNSRISLRRTWYKAVQLFRLYFTIIPRGLPAI